MDLNKGDIIIGVESFNKDIKRIILKKRKTGYDWKYADNCNRIYRSENSSDPFFEFGWVKIEQS